MANTQDKYKDYSKEELVEELETLKKKKYGLIWDKKNSQELLDAFVNWENMPENFIPKTFPVLKENKKLEISTDKNKPINLLIEGDNYHSLAVLNFTHKEAIDLIYIDPPYNMGNQDFIYNDKFVDKEDPWRHSKWLSFMEKRLVLAKNLLKNDGVLFCSIGNDELAQLKLLCDEIFNEINLVDILTRVSKTASNKGTHFSPSVDYILCYAKDIGKLNKFKDIPTEAWIRLFNKEDERGKYREISLYQAALDVRPNQNYFITCPDGSKARPPDGKVYRWTEKTLLENLKENKVVFKKARNSPLLDERGKQSSWNIYTKTYFSDREEEGKRPRNFLEEFINRQGADLLSEMGIDFDYSKPVDLIKYLIQITNKDAGIKVLDFFAGSGTTGHAVLELNKQDGSNRQFILCTNNENNICTEVCYPRLEKAIHGYKSTKGEKVEGLSGNLKYLKRAFVPSQPTDKNKRDLVNNSAEMLSIKEGIYDLVANKGLDFHIYKNDGKYLGIIFNEETIDKFISEANKLDGYFAVYCFSYSETPPTKEFEDMKNKYTLQPIPEIILKVYREIFKK